MQTVNEFIAELADSYRRDGIPDRSHEWRQQVDEAQRKFGRSEHVVLIAIYIQRDRYDRIPPVVEELCEEDLLAVARVLLEDLYNQTLYDEGPYRCRDSWYCLSGVRHGLDVLTRRIGYLQGARNDDEADKIGRQAIEDRWGIIIRAAGGELRCRVAGPLGGRGPNTDGRQRQSHRGDEILVGRR